MKGVKKSILVLLMGFLCFSCEEDDITCLRVSGDIVTQKRKVEEFKSIFFNDVGNLYISQGNDTEVVAKGQENVVNAFKAKVVEGELRMFLDRCFNGEDYQLDIYITAPDFEQIEMAGTGALHTESVIIVDEMTLIHSGVTRSFDFEITADSLKTIMVGNGKINFSGHVNYHNILLTGLGDIEAYSMPTKSAEIRINGKGDVFVYVSEKLSVKLDASGNIYYKGNPTIEKSGNGAGKVINHN